MKTTIWGLGFGAGNEGLKSESRQGLYSDDAGTWSGMGKDMETATLSGTDPLLQFEPQVRLGLWRLRAARSWMHSWCWFLRTSGGLRFRVRS